MTFRDDNGNVIEVSGTFAMTKQAVSIFSGEIKGDVSINFSIDKNSQNQKTLGYYGPQMNAQVAFTKQSFNRLDTDGNILDRGYIVIQDDDKELDCFYVSGNSNWSQLLNGLITELDYTGIFGGNYSSRFVYSAPTTAITGGVIYPVIDFCYNLNKGNADFITSGGGFGNQLRDSRHDTDKYPIFEFYPCLYLHSLIEEIFSQNGLKFNGNLFDDPFYKSLIVPASSAQMKQKPFSNISMIGSSQSIPNGSTTKYISITSKSDPENITSLGTYTSIRDIGLIVTISCIASSGVDITSVLIKINGLSSGGGIWVTGTQIKSDIVIFRDDIMEFYIVNTGGTPRNATINIKIEVPELIRYNEPINPVNFLPDIKCLDVFKFIVSYFGCSVYFNDFSKTITANIIDKIPTETAINFSDYYISHRSEYTVAAAKNNYIKLSKNDNDSRIIKYNQINKVGYGEGNLQTGNTLVNEKTLSTLLTIPSSTLVATNGILSSNVPLINLSDDGDPVAFSAITSLGAQSQLTVPNGTIYQTGEIIRVVNSSGADLGYFTVITITATTLTIYLTTTATGTGLIYKQSAQYQDCGFRILTVKPFINASDFSTISDITIGQSPLTPGRALDFACFTKPFINLPIDQWKSNCAIENPTGSIDPTIKEQYFNKIGRFFKNPPIRCQMILPQTVFKNFDFSQFIYLKTENLTGYFFVDNIRNYKDGVTPVEVNLYML